MCADVAATGYHYVPAMIPISPSSMSYKMLLDNLPFQYQPKKSSKKRDEDSMDEVERRMSVRQSECAYRYKEIVVKKCNKYTQIWLNTHTKLKNCLNPQVCGPFLFYLLLRSLSRFYIKSNLWKMLICKLHVLLSNFQSLGTLYDKEQNNLY